MFSPVRLRMMLSMLWLAPRRPEWSSPCFRLGRVLALFLHSYLALGLVLVLMEDELVFRAKAYPRFWCQPPTACEPYEATLPLLDGTTVHAWWFEPPGWTPERGALLHCHGHGCNLSHLGESALRWRNALGRGVLLFDYPGFGKSSGTPSEDGCYAAAQAAVDWLVASKKTSNILVYGHSMGGAVAIDLAGRRPVRGLFITSSFTSMPDAASVLVRIYPTGWLMHNRFDSVACISACNVPVFMAHGTNDGRVPLAQGQTLFAACPSPRKQFLAVDGAGHDLEHDTRIIQAAKQFFDRHVSSE